MEVTFHVLVIDDDQEIRNKMQRSLTRLGCMVSLAETAEAGMVQLKRGKYDAIFASLCVRTVGGRAVARWAKNNGIEGKFFIITSWKGELETRLLRLDGIHDVIRKPLSFSELKGKVEEHLY